MLKQIEETKSPITKEDNSFFIIDKKLCRKDENGNIEEMVPISYLNIRSVDKVKFKWEKSGFEFTRNAPIHYVSFNENVFLKIEYLFESRVWCISFGKTMESIVKGTLNEREIERIKLIAEDFAINIIDSIVKMYRK